MADSRKPGFGEFCKWKLGQPPMPLGQSTANNVAGLYKLEELRFATSATDVMVGESVFNVYATFRVPRVCAHARVLPQRDGVKVCLMALADVASRLDGAVVLPL